MQPHMEPATDGKAGEVPYEPNMPGRMWRSCGAPLPQVDLTLTYGHVRGTEIAAIPRQMTSPSLRFTSTAEYVTF